MCEYMYVYVNIYVCRQAYMHMHASAYVSVYMDMCVYQSLRIRFIYVCVYEHICVQANMYASTCMYLYIHVYVIIILLNRLDLYANMFLMISCIRVLYVYCILSYGGTLSITKPRLYNFDPLQPYFYIVKLRFTGVYIIFLISAQKHRLWVLVRTASARRF